MWSGRTCSAAALAAAMGVCGLTGPAAGQNPLLRAEIAAPLKTALTILDEMCLKGASAACSGARVLRERQTVLMAANAKCARGHTGACTGLVSAGYELEALAAAVSRLAQEATLAQN